jgi:hypothetical protein
MDARGRRGVGRAKGDESATTMEALRSFWRRFWNHIVTALGSLVVPELAGERARGRRDSVRTNRAPGQVIRVVRVMGGMRGGRAARAWRAGSQ